VNLPTPGIKIHLPLLLLMTPLLLAATGDRWREVARSDLQFARSLANEHLRYGPDFASLVKGIVVSCEPDPGKLAVRNDSERREIQFFCNYLCRPWHDAWAEALEPCDSEPAPKWCDNPRLAAEHLEFGAYFDTLGAELNASTDNLERYNIMLVVAKRLESNVLRDYPRKDIDGWLASLADKYLRSVSPEDAIAVGQQLSGSISFGKRSAVAKVFRGYASGAPGLATEQRKQLGSIATVFEEKSDD
jgi:hypothetical protein